MLKAIFFDLDDTLLVTDATHREAVAASCAEAALRCPAVDAGCLEAAYLQVGRETWLSFDLPARHESAVGLRRKLWATALDRLGVRDERLTDALAEHHTGERRARYRLFPDALETLERLHRRYHLGIITNGVTEIQREKIGCLGIERYFATILVSQAVGIAKPDTGIFERALGEVPCEPWEAVMVGDSLSRDIAGARAAGLHTLWMRLGRAHELWADLSTTTLRAVPPLPTRGGGAEAEGGLVQPQACPSQKAPPSLVGKGDGGLGPLTTHAVLECVGELLRWLEQFPGTEGRV